MSLPRLSGVANQGLGWDGDTPFQKGNACLDLRHPILRESGVVKEHFVHCFGLQQGRWGLLQSPNLHS